MLSLRFAALTALLSVVAGCNPYDRFTGEVNAGPVDPISFPAAYLGTGGNRLRPGSGYHQAIPAFVAGAPVDYFSFPFSTALLTAGATDPTRSLTLVTAAGAINPTLGSSRAFIFDEDGTTHCEVAEGYEFDAARDAVSLAERNTVFTALPTATYGEGVASTTNYNPIYARVPTRSVGNPCQAVKSEKTLLAAATVDVPFTVNASGTPIGTPDNTFRAMAMIEPGAAVYRSDETPESGLGIQSWGWFRKYLTAYIDGGDVPFVDVAGVRRMVPQRLFVPVEIADEMGMAADGEVGQGYDVLEFSRAANGASYSPVCEVTTYTTPVPVAPDMLPKDAATLIATFGPTFAPGTPRYVFCLQTR